ncbi:alpha-galactosidase [Cellulomonas sp. PhB150]|uniref:alpha-galactosidase n=1 Tax=Cellulomonas sp. PhB150 TaxID=2485188 RepID=UPI000F46CD9F|nr:alpha-galactosidase [Cellulomonas sp. PhB150]ROS21796.1 alpha-galactosidase [Cellulomonas sp. PhB150]
MTWSDASLALGQGVLHRSVASGPGEVVAPWSCELVLDASWSGARLAWWDSAWSGEWAPRSGPLASGLVLETTAGRSSARHHPFLVVDDGDRALLLGVAWSGNWRIQVVPGPGGTVVRAGLPDEVRRVLGGDETWTLPGVLVARADEGGVESASAAFVDAARLLLGHQVEPTPAWNHWWPYEDAAISEDVLVANAAVAARHGIGTAVLDAGWFGAPGSGLRWTELRGDWELEDTDRFPGGLARAAAATREAGCAFGLWLEPEAVGAASRLRTTHPELLAVGVQTPETPRPGDGPHADWPAGTEVELGLLCLGDARARDLVVGHVDRLVALTDLRWLKLDLNVDPGLGCTRTDHDHGPHDGLVAHVEGLYAVLDRIRAAHPDVVVETCSSGGMRWDLGIAAHCDVGFASDTDWPEHAAAGFWAASLFFPPERLYGWCDSQWGGSHAHQTFRAEAWDDEPHRLADALAIAMLGRTGVSQRLVDLPPAALDLVGAAMAVHSSSIAPLLPVATVRRHGAQPEREGLGGRWPVVELVGPSSRLLASLPLAGASVPSVRLAGLAAGSVRLEPLFPADARAVVLPVAPDGTCDVSMALPADRCVWFRVTEEVA